jgi:hypothetical protein
VTRRDEAESLEQAWRAKQGPDVAMRYKFRPTPPFTTWGARHWCIRRDEFCTCDTVWKVARSPYSVTGVRYYCDAHCPDVPEGTP